MIAEDTHNYGRLVLPDFIPHSGGFSMDNPEYILQVSREPASSLVRLFAMFFIVPVPHLVIWIRTFLRYIGSKLNNNLGYKKFCH
jgi:hypothetical protein